MLGSKRNFIKHFSTKLKIFLWTLENRKGITSVSQRQAIIKFYQQDQKKKVLLFLLSQGKTVYVDARFNSESG